MRRGNHDVHCGLVLAGLGLGYVLGSLFLYSATHPELTQMQVWQRIGEALVWFWEMP